MPICYGENINLHERKGTSKSNRDAQIKRIEIEFNTKGGNDWNKYFQFVINRYQRIIV